MFPMAIAELTGQWLRVITLSHHQVVAGCVGGTGEARV